MYRLNNQVRRSPDARSIRTVKPARADVFVDPSGFGARILGWLEHGRTGEPVVRAIALATVDIVTMPGQGAQQGAAD